MTVIVSLPSQEYAPQALSQNVNLTQNSSRMVITLTRESWPAGPVGGLAIIDPNGVQLIATQFEGGDFFIHGHLIDKQQLPVYGPLDANGVPGLLPKGHYTFNVSITQPVTTSVLIERF